jgi:hypothetical protein
MALQPTQPGRSEVAALLAQIDAEYAASQLALSGLATGTARHEVISAKTARIGLLFEQLGTVVESKEEAMRLLVEHQKESEEER